MLSLELPCSARLDAGARQGGGSAQQLPQCHKQPLWGCDATKGRGDQNPSGSLGPPALVQLHGQLRAPQCSPVWGHHPGRMEQSEAAHQMRTVRKTPNLIPNPHPTTAALK